MTRIAMNGAAGRMGRRIVALTHADPDATIVAAVDSPKSPEIGRDAGTLAGIEELGVPLTGSLEAEVDAVIDFSVPAGAMAIVETCLDRQIPLVMATTGFTDEQRDYIEKCAATIPIVWAPNMSMAVNLTMKLVSIAAKALADLPSGADVEILERHHRFKEDSPSGTALKFGELVAEQMGQTASAHGREGRPGARPHAEIGYHAIRVGDNPGEHTIIFGMLGETIELRVGATNRDCYATGAIAAAKFAAVQQPGMFSMYDVLGL